MQRDAPRSEFLDIAAKVLAAKRTPMTVREIWETAESIGMVSDAIRGKTPKQTLKSKLSVDIRRNGEESEFLRVAPGRFLLRRDLGDRVPHHSPPLAPPGDPEERVAVFPVDALERLGRFQGLNKAKKPVLAALLQRGLITSMLRSDAEESYEHKQIITYVLVRRGPLVLSYTRGRHNRVESYLRGAKCVGFGGHVMAGDATLLSTDDAGIYEAAARELIEELQVPDLDRTRITAREGLSLVGFLNDDSSANGRRHFAAVFTYDTSADISWEFPRRGEKAITQLRWIDPRSRDLILAEYEYWSQLCLRELYPGAPAARPSFRVVHRASFRSAHILSVVGPIGSGKSEAVKALRSDFGYAQISAGRVVADILAIPPVPATPREEFQAMAEKFISGPDGPAILAHRLVDFIQEHAGSNIVIDGIRHVETLAILRRHSPRHSLAVLYVHTPPDVAYQLFKERERADIGVIEFYALREAAVESEVESLLGESDVVLYNWRGSASYREAVSDLMRELGGVNRGAS